MSVPSSRVLIFLLLALLLAGCERAPQPVKPPAPTRTTAHIRTIAQLPPNRPTHVAVDLLGNVLYTSETEKGHDGVMIVGQTGLPRATELTSVRILSALGESVGGSGTIQDIAVGADGQVYFLFIGGKDRAIRAALGRFDLPRGALTLLLDTDRLMSLTGMGDSIALARGSLLSQGARMSLWIRHIDRWGVFHFDVRRITPGSESEFTRSFTKITGEGVELNLSQKRYEMSPGPGQDLYLMDYETGTLWQVDPTGAATVRAPLTGFPSDLSLPLALKDDRLMIFAADSPPLTGEIQEFVRRSDRRITYPALLTIDGKDVTSLGRDDFRAFAGFPVYAMRLRDLVQAPDGTFVAYDQASGQLMRITLTSQ